MVACDLAAHNLLGASAGKNASTGTADVDGAEGGLLLAPMCTEQLGHALPLGRQWTLRPKPVFT